MSRSVKLGNQVTSYLKLQAHNTCYSRNARDVKYLHDKSCNFGNDCGVAQALVFHK